MNPHGPCGPTDFHTLLRLSPPPTAFAMGFGVWTIPSPCPDLAPGVRCRPSSLYTFPAYVSPGLARDCHIKMVSPTLSSSASPVSRRALKFFSSPLRLPFRHARVAASTTAVYDRAGLPEFTRWFPDPQSAAKPGISGGFWFPFVFVLFGTA